MLQNLHLVIIFSFLFRLMSFNFFTGWSHFWRLPLHFTFGSFHLFIFTFLGFWARKAGDHLLFKTTDSLFLFHGFNYFWWKWIQSIRFKKDPIDGVNFCCFPCSTLSPAPVLPIRVPIYSSWRMIIKNSFSASSFIAP